MQILVIFFFSFHYERFSTTAKCCFNFTYYTHIHICTLNQTKDKEATKISVTENSLYLTINT